MSKQTIFFVWMTVTLYWMVFGAIFHKKYLNGSQLRIDLWKCSFGAFMLGLISAPWWLGA